MSVNPTINAEDQYIDRTLKKFKLVDIRNNYNDLIEEAKRDHLDYKSFLIKLIQYEEHGKIKRMVEKNTKSAGFHRNMTLENYDFAFHNYRYKAKIMELASLNFLTQKENVILIGPPGVGKSHIGSALGIKACEAGKKVMFTNANDFIEELAHQALHGALKALFNRLARIDLIFLDELGYLKMDKEKESLFFQFIRHRYEKNALIITTNLPFERWGEIFTSQLAATAILDRLVHHSHIVSITGESYRVKGKPKEGN
ncbi:IS21-like element helper ATPase IstB [Desulfitobacterium sp.]|uniref:IS21-like element helper ATPase IstB n=1 Tax=Desulfitobacterium sp. TaxID=49981 RepID=UPI002B20795A|nr:IS21-like element helper ATPase IstB [Desulfitobacterium sp.]MEA4901051.1 IS21-like element helper ATPase IstB [Desulfitobacterium sp.]